MSRTEIRLYNHDNAKAFYKTLSEQEFQKISEVLGIDMFGEVEDKENKLQCLCCRKWVYRDMIFKAKVGNRYLCFDCY